jgi:sterol desaturase/sphingolipid hydroxylase (fatty acid hydroxylase superfamily)
MIKAIFDSYGALILVVIFIVLFLVESKCELRKRVQNRWKRILINFILSLPAFTLLRILFIPAMVWLSVQNQSWRIGLNQLYQAPVIVKAIICFLLLDYSNYCWHILLHKLPILWRFHLVHHTDLDLDITTAFRFHFGEIIASIFFRGAAIIIIGALPPMVLIYEIAFEAATQFHHSNARLPFQFEKALNYLVVTPRMHGIHHSTVKKETDSNYSVVFSFWDRLHRTVRLNVSQAEIVTGVPSYRDEKELTVANLLMLPFMPVRTWQDQDRRLSGNINSMKP